jgi:hypothetical protein
MYNSHPLRSERSRTPHQLWHDGMDPHAIEPEIIDDQLYGVDHSEHRRRVSADDDESEGAVVEPLPWTIPRHLEDRIREECIMEQQFRKPQGWGVSVFRHTLTILEESRHLLLPKQVK